MVVMVVCRDGSVGVLMRFVWRSLGVYRVGWVCALVVWVGG